MARSLISVTCVGGIYTPAKITDSNSSGGSLVCAEKWSCYTSGHWSWSKYRLLLIFGWEPPTCRLGITEAKAGYHWVRKSSSYVSVRQIVEHFLKTISSRSSSNLFLCDRMFASHRAVNGGLKWLVCPDRITNHRLLRCLCRGVWWASVGFDYIRFLISSPAVSIFMTYSI